MTLQITYERMRGNVANLDLIALCLLRRTFEPFHRRVNDNRHPPPVDPGKVCIFCVFASFDRWMMDCKHFRRTTFRFVKSQRLVFNAASPEYIDDNEDILMIASSLVVKYRYSAAAVKTLNLSHFTRFKLILSVLCKSAADTNFIVSTWPCLSIIMTTSQGDLSPSLVFQAPR
jgi:hypothetical protein